MEIQKLSKDQVSDLLERNGFVEFQYELDANEDDVIFDLKQMLDVNQSDALFESSMNYVELGHGEFRSGSHSKLGLHQEGYHLRAAERPKYLCLHCLAPGINGETYVVDTASVMSKLKFETLEKLHSSKIRFNRLQSRNGWTESVSLIWDYGDGKHSMCYAESEEGFRSVEILGVSESERKELERILKDHRVEIRWSRGKTLIIDNFRCLHGRAEVGKGAERKLLRVVF